MLDSHFDRLYNYPVNYGFIFNCDLCSYCRDSGKLRDKGNDCRVFRNVALFHIFHFAVHFLEVAAHVITLSDYADK